MPDAPAVPTRFAIVCKTHRPDLVRAQRFIASVALHNREQLPVFLIVPEADRELFETTAADGAAVLLSDEAVVASHPQAAALGLLERYRAMPGYLSQQVVKAEAWRLLGCEHYLCADADAIFLRDFALSDFLAPAGHAWTQLHQSRDFHALALALGHTEVFDRFLADSARMKERFGRIGPDYDFGPLPLVWSARVWRDLDAHHLAPLGMTLWDAIEAVPIETRWYGEALLAYRGVPIDPVAPFFRVYHYDWQHALLVRHGETEAQVARQFLGVVYQSNWEFESDVAGARSRGSRWARRFQRWRRTRGI